MKTKDQVILAMAAIGLHNLVPSPDKRRTGKPRALSAPYGTKQDLAICHHNEAVDQKKRERLQRRIDNKKRDGKVLTAAELRVGMGLGKINHEEFRKKAGCSDIRQLIPAYQNHSANVRKALTAQHKAEYPRQTAGRSDRGVSREAYLMTENRQRRNNRISKRVAGNASRTAVTLVNLQHAHAEKIRLAQWDGWEPTGSANIWHNEVHDVYMFSDETGDLFVFNPNDLCFETAEKAEEAMGYYISHLAGRLSADQLGEAMNELGSTLVTAPQPVTESCMIRPDRPGDFLHDLYKDGDADIPDAIKDRNGQVAIEACRKCGQFEAGLSDPCVDPSKTVIGESFDADDETYALPADPVQNLEKVMTTTPHWTECQGHKLSKDGPAIYKKD